MRGSKKLENIKYENILEKAKNRIGWTFELKINKTSDEKTIKNKFTINKIMNGFAFCTHQCTGFNYKDRTYKECFGVTELFANNNIKFLEKEKMNYGKSS